MAIAVRAYRWRDARTVMRYGAILAVKGGTSGQLARWFNDVK